MTATLSPPSAPKKHWWDNMNAKKVAIWLSSVGIAAIGWVSIAVYSGATQGPHMQYLAVGILTSIAAALTGGLLGFLFGIPRYVSSGQLRFARPAPTPPPAPPNAAAPTAAPPTPPPPPATPPNAAAPDAAAPNDEATAAFEPSSNLAEVSDWLTKVLLGAGLVQLTQLSDPAVSLINSVGAGLTVVIPPNGAAKVAAGSIMLAYSVWGFMVTYIATTIWYKKQLEKDLEKDRQRRAA